jgi:histidinol-phosphate phosphatase family protein
MTNSRPALFFDCDGVLNDEPGLQGAVTPDDVKILPGAGDAVRRAREAGRITVAVTNRPQVARGLVTLEGLSQILGRVEALLAMNGGVLDRVYFCPHHPEAGFAGEVAELKIRCECRKPGDLMLRWAFADLPIDRRKSALIGDSLRDIGAARRAGIWAYGVRTGYGCRDRERYQRETGPSPTPDLMFDSVAEAVDFELGYEALATPAVSAIQKLGNRKVTPLIVGICGRSRAGKTVAAHAVARALKEQGVSCMHVRLDDWTLSADERPEVCSGETRDRADIVPDVIAALRARKTVRALADDAASRGLGASVTYEPSDESVFLLEGKFAGHPNVRELLDLIVFVEVPAEVQRTRFITFYRWQGFDEHAIENLWRQRSADEWPEVDQQRDAADLTLKPGID